MEETMEETMEAAVRRRGTLGTSRVTPPNVTPWRRGLITSFALRANAEDVGCRMQDVGCMMQEDAGCRMSDAGCSVTDVG
jgi:hypothetical protein